MGSGRAYNLAVPPSFRTTESTRKNSEDSMITGFVTRKTKAPARQKRIGPGCDTRPT